MSEKTFVDNIEGKPVYYLKGKFIVEVDGVWQEATSIANLKAKMQGLTGKPTKVIDYNLWIAGDYGNGKLKILTVVAPNKKMVYKITDAGKKERYSSDHLYIYTPEIEQKLIAISKKANDLRTELTEAMKTARVFP